jgi:hypothetical protein
LLQVGNLKADAMHAAVDAMLEVGADEGIGLADHGDHKEIVSAESLG